MALLFRIFLCLCTLDILLFKGSECLLWARHSAKCGGIKEEEDPVPTLEEFGSKVLIIFHTADQSLFNLRFLLQSIFASYQYWRANTVSYFSSHFYHLLDGFCSAFLPSTFYVSTQEPQMIKVWKVKP